MSARCPAHESGHVRIASNEQKVFGKKLLATSAHSLLDCPVVLLPPGLIRYRTFSAVPAAR